MSPDRVDIILEIILATSSGSVSITPNQRRTLEPFAAALSGAAIDARARGFGYMMIHPDGKATRLDPDDVMRRQDQTRYKRD